MLVSIQEINTATQKSILIKGLTLASQTLAVDIYWGVRRNSKRGFLYSKVTVIAYIA